MEKGAGDFTTPISLSRHPVRGLVVNVHPFVHGGFTPWRRRKVALACSALARMSAAFPGERLLGPDLVGEIRGASEGTTSVVDLIRRLRAWESQKRIVCGDHPLLVLLCRAVFSIWLADAHGLPLKGGRHCADYPNSIAGGLEESQYDEATEKLRCIFWGVHSGSAFDPLWASRNGRAALAIAQDIDSTGDFGAISILADALEDGGCAEADILDHCRRPGPHAPGCGVVDLVIGRSEGPLTLATEVALYHKHLAFLTREEATAFTLHWCQWLPDEQAAAAMGLSVETWGGLLQSLVQKQGILFDPLLPW